MKLLPSFEDAGIRRADRETYERIAKEKMPDYDAVAAAVAPGKTIYFVGIGGISMSGLCEYAFKWGARCAGSDYSTSAGTARLKRMGVTVFPAHEAKHIDLIRPDLVVYSNAASSDNPELVRARELGIPAVNRSVFLGAVNRMFRRAIHVAGTNGKTTTTAMCALMLMEAGLDPTVHLGAELREFQSTVRMSASGQRDLFLSEACEYQRGFFHYEGTAVAILNIVHDHIDTYPTIEDMIDAFARFVALQPENACVLLPFDDPNVEPMWRRLEAIRPGHAATLSRILFGPEGADAPASDDRTTVFTYRVTAYDDGGHPSVQLYKNGSPFLSAHLAVIGEFNVKNATAAAALADLAGASPTAIQSALETFHGAEGRFTYTGTFNGADIYIDYAHHPTSVEMTVNALKNIPKKRLLVAFQPMTHSRARGFFNEFVDVLTDVRPVLISEVFDNREKDTTISSRAMCESINARGGDARYFPDNAALESYLRRVVEPGDVVLIMGGGTNILEVGDRLTGRKDHTTLVTK